MQHKSHRSHRAGGRRGDGQRREDGWLFAGSRSDIAYSSFDALTASPASRPAPGTKGGARRFQTKGCSAPHACHASPIP